MFLRVGVRVGQLESSPDIQLQKNTTREFAYPQKSGSSYPIYPKSMIKVYTQAYIVLHRPVVCVEFQLQIEKSSILEAHVQIKRITF
jgi:hypothetical protein